MPLVQDFLLRFRRVWAPPGPAAGQAGVPVDRQHGLDDELRELSAELAAIEIESQRMVQAAEAEANAIAEAARSESAQVVEAARIAAPQVRADAASSRIKDRRAEIDRMIAAAEAESAAIRLRAEARVQPVVDRIVDSVFAAQPAAKEAHARVVGCG